MLTPDAQEKRNGLRRMKAIATGAFLLMAIVFFLTVPLGNSSIFWVFRWDYVNAFAEAAMIGALADWFAVVALFRHPLGIPIWHTAIIPKKKDDIGRNLGNFVETRLLSVENVSKEIRRFSASSATLDYLATEEHRQQAAGWITTGIERLVHQLDDGEIERVIRNLATRRLSELNAAELLGNGLGMVIESGKHRNLVDQGLRLLANWLPSKRDTVHQLIENSLQRMLKWGSKLVPEAVVDRATEQALMALIDVLNQAANDPDHPLRADLEANAEEWVEKLKHDPEWQKKVNDWKQEMVDSTMVRDSIANLWSEAKRWLADDIAKPDSIVRGYALRLVNSFHSRLASDTELQSLIDDRLRSGIVSFLGKHHSAIGALIQRVVDSWDGKQLSEELELNIGRDLQYIRLNGTFIGGLVGLLIHLIR